jgi:hypothetical protein
MFILIISMRIDQIAKAMYRLRLPLAAAGLLVCTLAPAQASSRRIDPGFDASRLSPSGLTLAQSKQVLRVVLKYERFKVSSPTLWIDGPWLSDGKPVVPGYVHFGVVYLANTQGHYAVDRSTGDVWQTESCQRYAFPALREIQKRISSKTGKKLVIGENAGSELGC